jgi:hypothetical protein
MPDAKEPSIAPSARKVAFCASVKPLIPDVKALVGAVASQCAQMLATLQVPERDGSGDLCHNHWLVEHVYRKVKTYREHFLDPQR